MGYNNTKQVNVQVTNLQNAIKIIYLLEKCKKSPHPFYLFACHSSLLFWESLTTVLGQLPSTPHITFHAAAGAIKKGNAIEQGSQNFIGKGPVTVL